MYIWMESRMILTTEEEFQPYLFIDDITQSYYSIYDGLVLHSAFQPIFNTSLHVIGYEALLRIHNMDMQPIRPDHFFQDTSRTVTQILNVERLSRIIHIRNFAFFSQHNTSLFLNILPESAIHFNEHKLPIINVSLLESRILALGLTPNRLTLEILEFHYKDDKKLADAIHDIKQHGFNIAIDDFGSGASSSHRVSLLKPDIIKIDRSLLLKYELGDVDPLLSAIQLAKEHNALTVIEGIETSHQHDLMKALGIDYFQGFLLGRPLPLHQQNHQAA